MKSQATKQGNLPQHHCCRHWGDDLCHGRSSEMQKVIQIAEIHFWPKKISQKSVNFDKFDFATKHRKLPVNHKNLKNNITFVY